MSRPLIPHIVLDSADRLPEKEAFRCDGTGLTYAELATRVGKLAGLLVEEGVRVGDRVGVLLSKSVNSAVAIYGIMSAGAAYVPIDPRAPVDRIAGVVADAGVRVLVSEKSKSKQLQRVCAAKQDHPGAGSSTISIVILDAPTSEIADLATGARWFSSDDVDSMTALSVVDALSSNDLAYIMYTSGSTGVPKGIMHTHSSGLAYATAAAELYGVRSDDRLSNHSPLHFDMSTFDYFSGPLAGATTIIVPESYSVLPASMSQLVQDEGMTIWYSVPLALIQMLTRGVLDQRDLSTLRWVLFGGEPFPPRHLQDLMRRLPNARFSNVYGPAEVNQCTYYNVPPSYAAEPNTTSVPLGQMWAAAEGIVVDGNDDVVAIGGTGELLVSTPTMMKGYWNRPDLDARAFFHREQDGESVVRFYRTGDVVRLREDGLMDFIGRGDRQVKIRGYRVELDEVERAVVSHQRVREAAAVAVDGPDGVKEIHVLILADSDDGPSDRELLTHLRSVLPPYALPTRVVAMDAFPRTGSGKIDRTRIEADIRNTRQTAGARV